MDNSPALDIIKEHLGGLIESEENNHGDTAIIIKKESVVEVSKFLKTDSRLQFTMLSDLFGMDFPKRKERIEVVYNFYSIKNNFRIFVKARADKDDTEYPSITSLFNSANWFEREVYDMFGLKFHGHPDMKRILNPDDWEGHPLLKDYPLRKRPPVEELDFSMPGYVELDKIK